MEIGLIGLGKMGYNLALNIKDHGHKIIAYDLSLDNMNKIEKEGIQTVNTLNELIDVTSHRRIIWMMVPAGNAVDELINNLSPLLSKHDILIDGGNSHYKDTLRRFKFLEEKELDFVDVGTSGGIEGARNGICAMIGAKDEVFQYIEELIKAISIPKGYLHTGANGSGHYTKMIHNGIEYGMMQAIGEGFEILKEGPFEVDYEQIARVWSNGSVIRGWLMELTESLFSKDKSLDNLQGIISSSGEGLWTIEEALELKVPAPVITESLIARFRSKQTDSFSGKVVAGLRNEFGGHGFVGKANKEN